MKPEVTVFLGVLVLGLGAYFLPLKTFIAAIVVFLTYHGVKIYKNIGPNPFAKDTRRPREPYIIDQKKRDAVIKQSFSPSKVSLFPLSFNQMKNPKSVPFNVFGISSIKFGIWSKAFFGPIRNLLSQF